ncbi:MAG: hypothetical protein K2X81_10745 [Candidatus Obscuribacterales bacterium]|nr:hypothetical protein [Candidatus Obscuribacterales bacterium]
MPQQKGAKRAVKVAARKQRVTEQKKEAELKRIAKGGHDHEHDHDHEHGHEGHNH